MALDERDQGRHEKVMVQNLWTIQDWAYPRVRVWWNLNRSNDLNDLKALTG